MNTEAQIKELSSKETTISFVTPCYNDGDTIEKLINSLNDQDLQNIEIIVVNDGSTDDSKKVLDGLYEQGKIDKVIHLEKNSGACVARNIGAKEAKGKYLSFLPADAFLYAGMARLWYNTLEDNPDYDFVYSGYRFVDEDGEPIPGNDYMSQPFDPYLLEVTNYIDGSFPIKREAFWKYAEIMKQPEGLWDKNIKSLQDWDFWLSVVKNGGKGVYIQDISFGTTLPHPGGLSYDSTEHWLERTEAIKAKHNIPIRKTCVASLGASWHAKRIAYILGADFKEMPSFKPHRYENLYVIGFYPEFAPQQGQMFQKNYYKPDEGYVGSKKIVHFVGSDIWQLYNVSMNSLKFYREFFRRGVDEVLCEADFTQKELKELGIEAKVVPIPPAVLYKARPLPNKFTVACYQPMVNAAFYRPNEMIEIAKQMPDVEFKFFGNPKKVGRDPEIKNIEHCGYITNMDAFISECSAIMRFPQHDGLPLSVLEFILAGRYSIQNVPITNSYYIENFSVKDAVEGLREVEKMAQVGLNEVGSEYWRKELDHDKYKQTIEDLFEYNPKEYWERRAQSWVGQAKDNPPRFDEVEKAIKKLAPKSVLDIGCGDGRFYEKLKEWGVEKYKGIDISENLIKAAQLRYPHEKDNFVATAVEDIQGASEKADVVLSYTCLQHIKDDDFPKAVEAIKKVGKKLILVEPTNFISRFYSRCHDYEKAFNVIEKVDLGNMTLMVCNLEA